MTTGLNKSGAIFMASMFALGVGGCVLGAAFHSYAATALGAALGSVVVLWLFATVLSS